ncbi:hypothetical protein FSP39_001344 [Pinctada imbricata]|uniref:B box-type domain-containing protein n=1 Tax=Pinctada imbricata TaxID=66713 RepID=A0AA89C7Q7_PINIB|nr:hypothetical protein FSP39_001344 [Pinctada imbricata]
MYNITSNRYNKMAFASSRIGAQEAMIKPCDLCEDEENVNWFCKNCDQNLCDGCKKTHLRSNVSKSHAVLSISEGFEMGKKNISNMCRDNDDPCLFLCRTCDKNICPTCLSMEHKVHDFVEMRKLHCEMHKPLDRVIKSKEDEMKTMTKNYEDLTEHANESECYLKERYAFIDDRVKAIKLAADNEGQELKEYLQEQKEQGDKEVKMGQSKIHIHSQVYQKEIETVRRELRLQTGSSLKGFVKESVSKLESLLPMAIAVPNLNQRFTEGNFYQTKSEI